MYKLLLSVLGSLLVIYATCEETTTEENPRIYRERMVSLVNSITNYAINKDSNFIVIPQNGIQLLTKAAPGSNSMNPNSRYLSAIDGIGRESVFYGYNDDNEATPEGPRAFINKYLQLAQAYNKTVIVIDYASDLEKMQDSYTINDSLDYISFAANHRELDVIPSYPEQPHEVNNRDIERLEEAENFLYLINTQNYQDKKTFISELDSTNYDMIILDLFFWAEKALTPRDVAALQTKANGGKRLVVAYMSIGEAEDYRYYWQPEWSGNPPEWLGQENPKWEGNYLVQYWQPEWQDIIYGNDSSYLDRILETSFDGVYLDLVDAYRRFEQVENQEN